MSRFFTSDSLRTLQILVEERKRLSVLPRGRPEYVGDKFNASIGTAPWTDDRLLILVGEKDDYEGPDTCKRFVAGLPEKKQRQSRRLCFPGGLPDHGKHRRRLWREDSRRFL